MEYVRTIYKMGTNDATWCASFDEALKQAKRRAKTDGPIHVLRTCCVVDSRGKTLHFKDG